MKIARITPSRGLVHSRTEAAAEDCRVLAAGLGHEWQSFHTHNLPIPDCFNNPCHWAWAWGADLFFILEEDVVPADPGLLFYHMLQEIEQGADWVTTSYPIGILDSDKNQSPLCFDGAGRLVWSATGCILLKRKCFELMPEPWFVLKNRLIKPGQVTWDQGTPSPYGCDIAFTFGLFQLGLQAVVLWDQVDHYKVRATGPEQSNTGAHHIEPLLWGKRGQQDGSCNG